MNIGDRSMSTLLPSPRILLGPGPSSVSDRTLEALGRAPIGYLDPELFALLETLRSGLRTIFGTANPCTLPLTGTGMAGMECCFANLIEPSDVAVIGVNGFFGGRMVEIASRYGAEVVRVDAEWGKPVDPEQMAKAIKANPGVKLVACVHAETSTGVRTSIGDIGKLAHEAGALFLADTVTSLGGIPVEIDKNSVDASYSASQKCMGAPPGLSPVTFSPRALESISKRKTPVRSWYFDLNLLREYFDGNHLYHHTVPVNLYYALNEAVAEIGEEGLEERYLRHGRVSAELISGLSHLVITPFASEGYRLPTLNSVNLPQLKSDEMSVRKELLNEYGIEIGGGLGELKGKIWRIGTMGASATHRNVKFLLAALKETLAA